MSVSVQGFLRDDEDDEVDPLAGSLARHTVITFFFLRPFSPFGHCHRRGSQEVWWCGVPIITTNTIGGS